MTYRAIRPGRVYGNKTELTTKSPPSFKKVHYNTDSKISRFNGLKTVLHSSLFLSRGRYAQSMG